jgi:archaellum biogenesis ATPase FlaH
MNFSDLNQIEGLQFIPVNEGKIPIPKAWQKTAQKHDLTIGANVGLVCGSLSGGVEAIDLDLKYDLTGKLFEYYKRLIHQMDKELLSKLVVQKTRGGGYHFIYRCSEIAGNQKLAQRPTTEKERKETYEKNLKAELSKGTSQEEAEKKATNAAKNDKTRVLIETRGEGGQIVCFPSKGYDFTFGDFYSISEITPEQRETLHNIARQFNQVFEEFRPATSEIKKQQKGLTTFEDYNERADVVALLENHGWKIVRHKAGKTIFLRPGHTTSATSGDYDHSRKWFSVFTTSSIFEPGKSYLPYAVYAMLECGGNFSDAAKKLYDLGYGDRYERQQEVNQKTPTRISLIDNDFSFIANPDDDEAYLELARAGKLPMGKTTGMPELDKHFLFKPGSFVIINGFDNVGKTSVILFLAMLSAIYHGWRWVIYTAENSPASCRRKMMEFYWNKPLRQMNDLEYKLAKQFVRDHFDFIKSEDDLYNYKDILTMTKKLVKRRQYHAVLIDPYNSLKIELTNASKLSTHEYHYEAISEIKQYTRNTGICFYINTHAVTSASRLKAEDKKSTPAPQKGDVEGGVKFANKADDFLTIHRDTQHPTEWMVTEIHVRKIKETETGGRPTGKDSPVRIKMMRGGCAFCEVSELGVEMTIEQSPIEVWHQKSKVQQKINIPEIDIEPEVYTNKFLDSLGENDKPF